MRFTSRTWFLISLLSLVAALFFWLLGNRLQAEKKKPSSSSQPQANTLSPPAPTRTFPLLTRLPGNAEPRALQVKKVKRDEPANALATATVPDPAFPHRLRNTVKPINQLAREDTAILLKNAFVDTTRPLTLALPEHLRSPSPPTSYVVQSRGPLTGDFRARLREFDAAIISYVPNNAYLVRVTPDNARRLAALPETQAVLPYEPYYKLDNQLLAIAVKREPLPVDGWLRLTFFPGERDAALPSLTPLIQEIISEQPSPFGPQLLVRAQPDSLPALAQLPQVQGIETYRQRVLLTDRARVIVGVSSNSLTNANYLGLTGSNVLVNINDSGVDETHPDLVGRVVKVGFTNNTDLTGHGTHVAGIIAGSGASSFSLAAPPGSVAGASFRGMAPQARLFFLPIAFYPDVNEAISDIFLQTTAARTNYVRRRTGPIISNNAWGNLGANEYDYSSARFDAAVRDALPDTTNAQPVLYVFASGNSGEGNDEGLAGNPNTISSPGNAKNVITVGAMEQFRFITNYFAVTNADLTVTTNAPFLGLTDSEEHVAAFSSRGNVGIGTEGQFGRFKPDLVAPGTFLISSRSRDWDSSRLDTNELKSQILKDLNAALAPSYRYESGSSMAAPVVSGVLALMQEFFEQRLPANLRRTNSPALMKALLINGARSLGSRYNLQVDNSLNLQGWGVVNLTNSLPAMMATQPERAWPIRLFDQTAANAVVTGQTRSWDLTLSTNSQTLPLRVTLAWTDPPGNPNVGIKLVNNLNLVVSNTITHEVYYGNNIPVSSDFTDPSDTNTPPQTDFVNNVENVFIRDPRGSNFVVSVTGQRVNVSAVADFQQTTGETNDVAQDFALVVAIGDLTLTNELTITPIIPTNKPPLERRPLLSMTNGLPLLKQRASAQPSSYNSRHGVTNQWNFYVFTNIFIPNEFSSLTNGTNVAFITFMPPNLARARNIEADIDLYVSKNPKFLDLEPAVMDAAFKSVTREGTESIVFTNAAIGDIFYIGVRSEDQQAAEYGLVGLSSDTPFDRDDNGDRILQGFPIRAIIPDGSADNPGSVQIFAIGIAPNTIQKVIVTNLISHSNMGDLIGILSHGRDSVVLNNHTLEGNITGTNLYIYDDSFFPVPFSQRTDGPGSLSAFEGSLSSGVWMLNMVDNSISQTGRVESLTIRVEPVLGGDLLGAGAAGLSGNVGPGETYCFFADVPPEATNLFVEVTQMSGPLNLLIQRETTPSTNSFDKMIPLTPPGGVGNLGFGDEPPLKSGRYFICVHNPSLSSIVSFHIVARVDLSLEFDSGRILSRTNALPLLDEGTVSSKVTMPVDKEISEVHVGVRINHPRPADLVLHLISPQGTRVVLGESRGGLNASGYGAGYETNVTYTVFTEATNRFPNLLPIKLTTPPYTNLLGGSGAAPLFSDGFENSPPGQYGSNQVVSGWTVVSGRVQLHGPGNTLGVRARSGTNFLELDTSRSPASVRTNFSTTPGTDYLLNFAYHRNPVTASGAAHALQIYYGPPIDNPSASKFIAVRNFGWSSTDIVFRATSPLTAIQLSALTSAGPLVDSVQVTEVIVTTNSFVLPEEAIDLLKGERAIGEWTLEVTDNRRGPTDGLSAALLGWQLQLKYVEPRPKSVILHGGRTYSGTLTNSQTNYFVIDVCESTTIAVSTLTGPMGKLRLLGDRSGLPTGLFLRDDFAALTNSEPVEAEITASAIGSTNRASTNSLATNGLARLYLDVNPGHPTPLQPGKRHFVAVHNINIDETNSYTLEVEFDQDDCHVLRPIIRLTNAVPHTNTIAVSEQLLDNYVFKVSSNALGVNFELFPLDGDLSLVVRHDPPPPDLFTFDYISDNLGLTNEIIFVKTNSRPISLVPGDWHLSVFNKTNAPVSYRIIATELNTNGLNIIRLTNDVPVDYQIGRGSALTNIFWFPVTNQNPSLVVDVNNLTGGAELLSGHNRFPPGEGITIEAGSATQPIRRTVIQPPVGDYYFAVRSIDTNDLQFTIRARVGGEVTDTNLVFINPRVQIGLTNICFLWNSLTGREYQLQAKTNIDDRSWLAVSPRLTGAGPTNSFCLDWPTRLRFFQIVQFPSERPAPVTPTQFVNPRLQITGANLCLNWASLVGTNYYVEAKTNIQDTGWRRLSSLITATSTNSQYCIDLPTPYRFFQIAVVGGSPNQPPPPPPPPPPTTTTQFIDPRLNVSRTNVCLVWASLVGTNYFVEAKTNIQDQTWRRISSLITATSTNSQYCLDLPTPYRFFQIAVVGGATNQPPPPPPTTVSQFINPRLNVSRTNLCLAWPSFAGTNYFVEAKANIQEQAWRRISPQITATGTNTQFCLDLPTPYRFYQIAVAGGATQPPPTTATNEPVVKTTSTNICVTWNSQIGTTYRLEGRSDGSTNLVYDNLVGNLVTRSYFPGNGLEFGDDVILAGANRLIKTFQFDYFLSPNASANERAELFFRANDGANNTPGTILYRSGEFRLYTGFNIIEASDLNVAVPQVFTWSLVITGIATNEQVALLLNGPPKVGNSLISLWTKGTNNVWSRPLVDNGDSHGSFSASITAVAETGANWTTVASVRATDASTTRCIDFPTSLRFFRVTPESGGSTTNQTLALRSPVVSSGGRLQFRWDAVVGQVYELQQSPNLVPPPAVVWTTVTNLTATTNSVTITDPTPATNSMRFYRLIRR